MPTVRTCELVLPRWVLISGFIKNCVIIWTISLQLMSFGYHYKDIVSFNSAMWGPLFAECACYVGPPRQVKQNDYFDNFAISQKDNADEGIICVINRSEGKKNKNKVGKKSLKLPQTTVWEAKRREYFHRNVKLIQPTPWKGSRLSCWQLRLKERSDITSPIDLRQLNCTSPYLGRRSRQGAWDQEE